MEKLKIKKGFFYGAGSIYGWKDDGYHIHGVGIARKYFDQPELLLEVEGQTYTLITDVGKAFINRYKSHTTVKGTKIGVVSRDLLQPTEKTIFDDDVEWFDNEI